MKISYTISASKFKRAVLKKNFASSELLAATRVGYESISLI